MERALIESAVEAVFRMIGGGSNHRRAVPEVAAEFGIPESELRVAYDAAFREVADGDCPMESY